ncbi:hypothetical protein CEXT_682781 [Caerostris extrusa]|uniref:Uncharacterized protein n=1 Tax=Caerostris extrusa TaxID=172846 RepID=A0AAV4QWW6_CAEEX|nr:hypothetical protein CEXT_682781 [Caerostris extrusa]
MSGYLHQLNLKRDPIKRESHERTEQYCHFLGRGEERREIFSSMYREGSFILKISRGRREQLRSWKMYQKILKWRAREQPSGKLRMRREQTADPAREGGDSGKVQK